MTAVANCAILNATTRPINRQILYKPTFKVSICTASAVIGLAPGEATLKPDS